MVVEPLSWCVWGGVLRSPQSMSTLLYLPRMIEQVMSTEQLEAFSTFDPFEITGCVLSGLLSSRFKDLKPTLGLVDVQTCYQHYLVLERLGFQAANLHCGGYKLTEEAIHLFRG